jgi:hypothetical protein
MRNRDRKISFDSIRFYNRWKQKYYCRTCDWIIFGLGERWYGPNEFCYKLCFFGFDIVLHLNVTYKSETNGTT